MYFFIGVFLGAIGAMTIDWYDYRKKKMHMALKVLTGTCLVFASYFFLTWFLTYEL